MKNILVVFCVFSLAFQSLFGQNISTKEEIAKARESIYTNPDYSISVADRLLKTEQNANDKADIYLVKSIAYIAKRDLEKSLQYVTKAQDLLKDINDDEIKTKVLVSIAMQYQQMQLFSKCLEILDMAEKQAYLLSDKSSLKFSLLGKIYALRGMTYKSQSNLSLALEKFSTASKFLEKIVPKELSESTLSVVHYNKGYCYLDLNQTNDAEAAFTKSAYFADKVHAKSLKAFALKGLADVYIVLKKHQEAITLLKQAELLSNGVGDLTLNQSIYQQLSDNYLALGNFQDYQIYNKLYNKTKFTKEQSELKSINNEIDNQVTAFQRSKTEMTITYNVFIMIAIGFGATIITLLVFFTRIKIKDNKAYQKKIKDLIQS